MDRAKVGVAFGSILAFTAACAPEDVGSTFTSEPTSAPDNPGLGNDFPPPPDAGPPAFGVHPDLGPTVHADPAPPPIFGGTLTITRDDAWAVAADPDRDLIYVVDLAQRVVHASIPLPSGSLPFRVAEDATGRVHVTLRGAGAVVTIDPASGKILATTGVCPDPRGLAQLANGRLAIACERGDVMLLAASDLSLVARERTQALHARDVVPSGEGFLLTTFQGARVLRFDGDAHFVTEYGAPPLKSVPTYAWRAAMTSAGTLVVSHQLASRDVQFSQSSGYLGCSGGPVLGAVSSLTNTGTKLTTTAYPNAVIPVDLAVSPDGLMVLVALPGSTGMKGVEPFAFGTITNGPTTSGCGGGWGGGPLPPGPIVMKDHAPEPPVMALTPGEVTAVAFTHAGIPLAQSREPALLEWLDAKSVAVKDAVLLSSISRQDTGHAAFHRAPVRDLGVACASCHAEGGEDGIVWKDKGVARRTQTLLGTVAATAPYHWSGDEASFASLSANVYTKRMHGADLDFDQTDAFRRWVFALAAPKVDAYADPNAVARGALLYEAKGCVGCHSTDDHPSKQSFDVGNGGAFQVPSLLGVGLRPPFMHDGCATTLAALLSGTSCGDSSKHGALATLTPAEAADLSTYLTSR